ncbi:MAG TPA: hypothetical protein VGO91_15690 [Pyrinomonadaceae bacterium]|jgi:ferric-dicitrate binding protein FerR (iron transport regulator)|nr:hypothetical protein [Pyrinomonadaceae bacterium]
MTLKNYGRKTLALLFIVALLNLSSTALLAAPATERAAHPAGELIAMGLVRVDGVLMLSGATIISGSTIRTEEKDGAIISLGQLGRMELSPGAILRLDFDEEGFMGQLETGRLRVSLPPKAHGSILTREGRIVAQNEEAARFTVEVREGRTHVATEAGRVELQAGQRTQHLIAGQETLFSKAAIDLPSPASRSQNSQNLSGNKLTGLVVAIIGVLTAIGLIITLQRSDKPQENFGGMLDGGSPNK